MPHTPSFPASSKTGRNDLCLCGSGMKYKHCCLKDEYSAQRRNEASNHLVQQLQRFSLEHFPSDLQGAWLDFNQQEAPAPLEQSETELQIFMPYFLFDWDPHPSPRRQPPRPGVVAETFRMIEGSRLPPLERLLLEQAIKQPLSFYEVVRCHPGEGLALRDLLIGGEVEEVVERTASHSLRAGDLVYAQLCELPGLKTLGRLAPLCIPPEKKPSLFALRATLRKKIAKQNRELTVSDLIRYRERIRTEYLDLRDRLHTPPQLGNTDGDPFVLHTLTYRTASAHKTFEALAPLALGIPKKELLKGAELDAGGALQSVEIPWQKKGNRLHTNWDHTILGMIRISGQSLVVDVNSEKRATRIQKEIERRLGNLATHQKTVTQDPAAALEQVRNGGSREGAQSASAKPASPSAFPPESLAELQREVENWINQKVPALGGRTPFEAVCDPEGRELVEALLLGWERLNETIADPQVFRPDIDGIRRLLQLPTHSAVQRNPSKEIQ